MLEENMKRHLLIILVIIMLILCVAMLAGCDMFKGSQNNNDVDVNGTYYAVKNGYLNPNDWIKLETTKKMGVKQRKWSDSDGLDGTFNMANENIELSWDLFSLSGIVRGDSMYLIQLDDLAEYVKQDSVPENVVWPEDNKYAVLLDADGGTVDDVLYKFEVGEQMSELPTPQKEGYKFLGWYAAWNVKYTSASIMPQKNVALTAKWEAKATSYSDDYVYFKPAIEGKKHEDFYYYNYANVMKYVYVELTSDVVGGKLFLGTQNNFDLAKYTNEMEYKVQSSDYVLNWYYGDWSKPNGSQTFTLNYGSNIQLLAVTNKTGQILCRYLLDLYVRQDYELKLYDSIISSDAYDSIRIIEGGDIDLDNLPQREKSGLTFDSWVCWNESTSSYEPYDVSNVVSGNLELKQSFKAKKSTLDLDGGQIAEEIESVDIVPYQRTGKDLPVPSKDGYDFIGWKNVGGKFYADYTGSIKIYMDENDDFSSLKAIYEPIKMYGKCEKNVIYIKSTIVGYVSDWSDSVHVEYKLTQDDNEYLSESDLYNVGAELENTAEVDLGYNFEGWYDGETLLTQSKIFKCSITNESKTYLANFSVDNNLSGLIFTSTENECVITGVADKNITRVTLPDYITGINRSAFNGCSGLTSITIPDSVTRIGESAFSNCYRLVEVYNKSSLTITAGSSDNGYVAYYAKNVYTTEDGSKLSTDDKGYVIYTDGGKRILVAYQGNETNLILPDGITAINMYAFYYCSGLTSVTIPDSVTSIGYSAFSGCSSLESITIPFVGAKAGVTSNDTYQYPFGYIFGTSSYTGGVATYQLYYGSSTSSMTYDYYYIPSSLKSVTITGGNILCGAFYNCRRLTSITIPNRLTSIGDYAFFGCSSLTSLPITDNITSIGAYAFRNCSGLTSIEIHDGVTRIGEAAFSYCHGLTTVNWNATACTYARSSDSIFDDCSNLTTINIGNNVTIIPSNAFRGCEGLTSITIPDSVTSIGSLAFYYCSGLTIVTIGKGVTSIGTSAFQGCSRLTRIDFTGTIAQWNQISKGSWWHDSVPSSCKVVCTDGTVSI